MKFSTRQVRQAPKVSEMTKNENLKNSRWRTAAMLKIVVRKSAVDCPISAKFFTSKQSMMLA